MSKKKDNVIDFPANAPKQDQNSVMEMAKQIESLKTENQKMYEMAAKTILKALDCKDEYTYGHSMRVCYFSMVLGKSYGLSDTEMFELQLSALFHDIGKIGTPDSILNKPTRLNDEEFKVMKEHPVNSWRILSSFEGFNNIALAAKHHHERFDGRGYPDQLKGEDIPLNARIILIADTFDAMTSTRVYRKGLSYDIAYNELVEFSGTQFDSELVTFFVDAMKREQTKNEDTFYIPLMDEAFNKDAA